MTNLSPHLLRGECNGASFEIRMIGHVTDRPFQTIQRPPAGETITRWDSDLDVATRAALRWLAKYYSTE